MSSQQATASPQPASGFAPHPVQLPAEVAPQPPLMKPWCVRCCKIIGNPKYDKPLLDKSNPDLGDITLDTLPDCKGRGGDGRGCTRCRTQGDGCYSIPASFCRAANVLHAHIKFFKADPTSEQARTQCEEYGVAFTRVIENWHTRRGFTADNIEKAAKAANDEVADNSARFYRNWSFTGTREPSNVVVNQEAEDRVRRIWDSKATTSWLRYKYLDGGQDLPPRELVDGGDSDDE